MTTTSDSDYAVGIRRALEAVESDRGEAIDTLTHAKRAGFESDRGPRIQVLNDFLGAEIARLESLHLRAPKRPPLDEMDRFFRSALQRAWRE